MSLAAPTGMNDVYRKGGVSNLHACAYYRTSEAYTAVSQTKPEQERGHDYRGHFFVNNELSDYVQEIKIPL